MMAWTGSGSFFAAFAAGVLSPAVSGQGSAVQGPPVGQVGVVRRPLGSTLSLAWSFLHDPAGGAVDRVQDVAVDPWRDVIACGNSSTGDAHVIKLDGFTGSILWERRLDLSVVDRAEALVIDEQGAIYIAGSTTPSPPFPDVLIAKMDTHGAMLWVRTFDEFNNNDEGLDLALGPDDSVVVTGHVNGLQGANFFTAKLNRAGDVLWTRQVDGGPDSVVDSAVAVAVDSQGGVLVTGTSKGQATVFTPDVVTVKYSPDGVLLWTQRHDGTNQSHDSPRDIAATDDGGCVVVGSTEDAHSGADPLVLRYGPDGSLHWLYDKGSNGGDSARAVVLDAVGNIYVAGSTWTSKNGFDVLAFKLQPNGHRNWELRWDGGEGRGDAGQAIALDGHGRVLVAGTSYHWLTETDVSSLVLDPQHGKVLASDFFDGPVSTDDAPLAIAADPSGGFVVGGFVSFPFEDFLVLRYDLNLP